MKWKERKETKEIVPIYVSSVSSRHVMIILISDMVN